MTDKFCVNCEHHLDRPHAGDHFCAPPNFISPVNGQPYRSDCYKMRAPGGKCENAELFVPKRQPEPPKRKWYQFWK